MVKSGFLCELQFLNGAESTAHSLTKTNEILTPKCLLGVLIEYAQGAGQIDHGVVVRQIFYNSPFKE